VSQCAIGIRQIDIMIDEHGTRPTSAAAIRKIGIFQQRYVKRHGIVATVFRLAL